MPDTITTEHLEAFKRGELRELRVGCASLTHTDRNADSPDLSHPDARWVMESTTTGTHTLLMAATDLARLNAHWRGFRTTANARLHG